MFSNAFFYIPVFIPVMAETCHFLFWSKQERLFYQLVVLFRHANGDVQNATRDALLRLNVCLLLFFCFFSLLEYLQQVLLLDHLSIILNLFFFLLKLLLQFWTVI